jgi:hypothetical protein
MLEGIEDKALKQELWVQAPANSTPTIIVPPTCQQLLVRDSHARMFHLAHAKVYALLRRSYFWLTIKRDVRKWLEDCPLCEVNKARQNTAHGLFSALPTYAPRARWCMDFQGQGKTLTGETEALALIDPTSRYVVVIPLANREADTWLQRSSSPLVRRTCYIRTPPPSFCPRPSSCLQKLRPSAQRRPWRTMHEETGRLRYFGDIGIAA